MVQNYFFYIFLEKNKNKTMTAVLQQKLNDKNDILLVMESIRQLIIHFTLKHFQSEVDNKLSKHFHYQ